MPDDTRIDNYGQPRENTSLMRYKNISISAFLVLYALTLTLRAQTPSIPAEVENEAILGIHKELSLSEGGSAPAEMLPARTGFRKIEIKNAIFMINGVPVKLKGANHHENWPDTGHTVSEDRMIRDLKLLKQVNANHVRTSHYTDDPRWYELADEYGIYLVAEANAECHGYMNVLDR